jgi:SpoVK/Ycf46/Vps4 family AAA+-type ATPase
MRAILDENPRKAFLRWEEGDVLQRLLRLTPHKLPDRASDADDARSRETTWLEMPGEAAETNWEREATVSASVWIQSVRDGGGADIPGNSLTIFVDLHPYLAVNAQVSLVRSLRNAVARMRQDYYAQQQQRYQQGDGGHSRPDFPYKTIVIIAPSRADISPELEREMVFVDFPLPGQGELRRTLNQLVESKVLHFPDSCTSDDKESLSDQIAGAGRGLTLDAFRLGLNSFAVSGKPLGVAHIDDILQLKADTINSDALQYTPRVEVSLGGLGPIKTWIGKRADLARLESVRAKYGLDALRGVMLCGVSGGGKSMVAKLIAAEFGLALLRLDVGALFGSYIGESEERTRLALELATVLAPVVLWIDEVEKAFSGVRDGGDNGVSARVFGFFLTWLAEKQDSVFVVATANDFKVITERFPEFARKGRFDEIFWVDLPDEEQRVEIFGIYLRKYLSPKSGTSIMPPVTEDGLAALSGYLSGENLPPLPGGSDLVGRLAGLLGNRFLSKEMTGAEIEHAVREATHLIYSLKGDGRWTSGEALLTLVKTVGEAYKKRLYRLNTNAQIKMAELRTEARNNGWPCVPDVDLNAN